MQKAKEYYEVTATFTVSVDDWKANNEGQTMTSSKVKDCIEQGMEVPIEDVIVKVAK